MKIFITLISCLLATASLGAAPQPKGELFGYTPDEKMEILVNNRILAKVNGKPISVIDVMKKMDIIFYKQFPEYTSSKAARHQFYNINWKHILQELIDKELILAESEEIKLTITNGDIRQEMESLFGPNIIANLDKIDMSFDEAWKIVKGDIVLRRMLMYRVNSKANRSINPLEIRTAYEAYIKENVKADEWKYRVISIRDQEADKGSEIATQIHGLIQGNPASFEELHEKIKQLPAVTESTTVNVSEEYAHAEPQLSPAFKEILTGMQPGAYTAPISQKSRSDKSTVFRIFYLKDKIKGGVPSFNDMEFVLKDKLLQAAIAKETVIYLKKLRKHFDVSETMLKEMVPEDFQPFSLKG